MVRERTRIDDVVRDYVALKPAGGGSLKGLCPFHDERSPSFHVTPSRGMYYCFGCQAGGDAISFVRAMHPEFTFTEAVQRLAEKAGVSLRFREGSAGVAEQSPGQRARLLEANRLAADFYAKQWSSAEAEFARSYLQDRGFNNDDVERFSVGYAPRGWDGLTGYLRKQGVAEEDLELVGLSSRGQRGLFDKFRGRILWPIRDIAGDVVGFGARKIYDDDEGPKYLNTSETPLYKKSQVLYGIDLAKRSISKQRSVVVVEGYTDVMACHLAGIDTAVAACGTAFGEGHIRVLRRFLMDDDLMRGQVIFTFDGDAAGRKAALRAFEEDQKFVAQTFVAVEPSGLDPCELRQAHGDEGVRALLDAKVPLFEFAIKSVLAGYDLDLAEGRVAALREVAPIVAKIKDPALRPEYARRLSAWLGLDVATVQRAVQSVSRKESREARPDAGMTSEVAEHINDATIPVQREVLKCVLQEPVFASAWFESLEEECFTRPDFSAVFAAAVQAGGPGGQVSAREWIDTVLDACATDEARSLARSLVVEPLSVAGEVSAEYVTSALARLLEVTAQRKLEILRIQMSQRSAAGEDVSELLSMMTALERYRRDVREQAEQVL